MLRAAGWSGAAAATAAISGCQIRLEDDAPDLPLLEPKSAPDQALLIATLHRVEELRRSTELFGPDAGLPAEAAAIHARQRDVLAGVLAALGVPQHLVASAAPSPAGTTTERPDLASVGRLEQAATTAGALADLAGATAGHRAMLASIATSRSAFGALWGEPPTWPVAEPLPADVAAALLAATRATGYGFEVAAAQLDGAEREAALAGRHQLRARASALADIAGSEAEPAPLGYDLPFPSAGPQEARRLLTAVSAGLVERGLDSLAVATPAPPSPTPAASGPSATLAPSSSGVIEIVRLQVEAVLLARSFAVAFTPFPGLQDR